MEELIKKLPNWLRWLLMIPIAFVAFVFVNVVNRFTFIFAFGNPTSFSFKIATLFVEGTIAVGAFILTLYMFAPNHKKIVALTGSIIIGIISVASSTLRLVNQYSIIPLWQVLIVNGLTIATCIYCCVELFKHEENKSKTGREV